MLKLFWHKLSSIKISYYRLRSLFYSEKYERSTRMLSEIIQHYHVIEKGLSMPERRYGFGENKVMELCDLLHKYILDYGVNSNQLIYAGSAVKEYKKVHVDANYQLDENLLRNIDKTINIFNNLPSDEQPSMSKEDFFRPSREDFFSFSHGRHSCRHFYGSVEQLKVENAIKLAQETTPSACNRQSVNIHLINNQEILQSVLALQSGNRGFGHTFDKLIVITTDMSYWNYITYIGGYVDGGIYMMNLLYSLYYYQIGACPLNAYLSKNDDIAVRKLIHLKQSEVVVGFIGIGNVTDNIILAKSGRKNVEEILYRH